jgi:hypothetical protein
VTLTTDPSTFSLALVARVRSTLPHDLDLNLFDQGNSVSLVEQTGTIGAATTSSVPLHFRISDCSSPTWEFNRDPRSGASIDGMPVYASYADAAISSEFAQAFVTLHWDRATQRRIDSAVSAMCAGRPDVSASVRSARLVVDRDLEANAVSRGFDPAIVLRSQLLLTTPASHVAIADTLSPLDVANGAPALIRSTSTTVHDGRAVLNFDWATSCATQSNPPRVQVTLRSGGRDWPERITVDSGVLAGAYLKACPGMSSVDLQNLQWNVLGPFQSTIVDTNPGITVP